MAKKRVNKRGKGSTPPRRAMKSTKQRVPRPLGVMSDPRVQAWDMLLRDPCSANLTAPCYAGVDSGYLVRTVNVVDISASATNGTVGNPAKLDALIQFSPFNISTSTGVLFGAAQTGAANLSALTADGVDNFITMSNSVARYRPVACCLKWVPNGPYGNRQGTVGLSYSSGQMFFSGQIVPPQQALNQVQRLSPNGSQSHEVRWLPTAVDENFTDTLTNNNSAAGVQILTLRGVDATYTGTAVITANGFVEITAVYEWVPSRNDAISAAPKAPLPFTSQQVLATIGDMGAYLFEGIRASGPGIMRAAVQTGIRYLTNGVGTIAQRGGALTLT